MIFATLVNTQLLSGLYS